MRRNVQRPGFTLIEMMTAVFIFSVVVGGLGSFFLGIQRMMKESYAEAELSLRARALREKLLFHVAPPHVAAGHGHTVWSGVLSGTPKSGTGLAVEGGSKVFLAATGIAADTGAVVGQEIQLLPKTGSSGNASWRCFGNDSDRFDEQWRSPWLDPGRLDTIPAAGVFSTDVLATKNLFSINLELSANGFTRRERVVVPVFGKPQVPGAGKVFHDN